MGSDVTVSIDLVTAALSLNEVSALVGLQPSNTTSHERGSMRGLASREEVWQETIWRLEPGVAGALPEQLEALAAAFPPERLSRIAQHAELTGVVNVAVFFSSSYGSVTLPLSSLRQFAEHGFELEITMYPCTEEG